jgi:putative oxidoreductase
MILTALDKFRDKGLLLLRIGVGCSFLFIHGVPKLMGGPELWSKLGGAMGVLGITFAPTFWGFMAAFAEGGGALALLLGFFYRPATALMAFTMFVAAVMHLGKGDGWGTASHAIEMFFVFASLFLVGPGTYSLDEKFKK